MKWRTFTGLSQFTWNEGEEAVAEVEVEVRDVLELDRPLRVARAHGGQALREAVEQEVDDREIVRREVPHHVHVVLEHAEVDADAVDVTEVAELALVEELLHLPHRRAVDERVVDHQGEALLVGERDHPLRVGDGVRERLLDEDVLAGLERLDRERRVRAHGRGDGDGIDVGALQERVEVGLALHRGVRGEHLFEALSGCCHRPRRAWCRGRWRSCGSGSGPSSPLR